MTNLTQNSRRPSPTPSRRAVLAAAAVLMFALADLAAPILASAEEAGSEGSREFKSKWVATKDGVKQVVETPEQAARRAARKSKRAARRAAEKAAQGAADAADKTKAVAKEAAEDTREGAAKAAKAVEEKVEDQAGK